MKTEITVPGLFTLNLVNKTASPEGHDSPLVLFLTAMQYVIDNPEHLEGTVFRYKTKEGKGILEFYLIDGKLFRYHKRDHTTSKLDVTKDYGWNYACCCIFSGEQIERSEVQWITTLNPEFLNTLVCTKAGVWYYLIGRGRYRRLSAQSAEGISFTEGLEAAYGMARVIRDGAAPAVNLVSARIWYRTRKGTGSNTFVLQGNSLYRYDHNKEALSNVDYRNTVDGFEWLVTVLSKGYFVKNSSGPSITDIPEEIW